MKATLFIRKDHERVRQLFEKFQNRTRSGDNSDRTLLEEIRREFSVHSILEVEVFYAELKNASTTRNAAELVDSLTEDHGRIDKLFDEIANSNDNDKLFESRMSRLIELVDAHIAREEEDLFAEARRVFAEQRLEELGLEMEHRQRLLTLAAA